MRRYNRRTGETFWEPPLPVAAAEDVEAEAEAEALAALATAACVRAPCANGFPVRATI